MRRSLLLILMACVGFSAVIAAQQITSTDLLQGLTNSSRWLTYSGDYSGQRHSPLKQITPENVSRLVPKWTFQTGVPGKFEASPVVIDGVIYITGPDNHAWAIDARTGKPFWRHSENLPRDLHVCCGNVNRGFAAYGDRLYLNALDAQLVALDRLTGNVIGGVRLADYKLGYSATGAPLVVKDKVIVGIAGGIFGTRGFLDAYSVETGKQLWRFWTTPEPGQPGSETWTGDSWKRGGGATWVTGSYDPESNLIYWGTGNPAPVLAGGERKGDNLFTNSLLAIHADTGKLAWYYQYTPHDTRDWDSAHVPVLAEITWNRRPRKVVMVANRNGFFYTFDRLTGELLVAKPFVKKLTWAKGIGSDGRPILVPGNEPSPQGTLICPDLDGGTNWMSPSFSPAAGLFYVTAREDCATYYSWEGNPEYVQGQFYFGGDAARKRGSGEGALRAIDPATGEIKWEAKYREPSMAGVLSTASDLVFTGDASGNIIAFNGRTGKSLWHFSTGSPIVAAPSTFLVDGTQYVLVPSGSVLFAFALLR